VAAGNRDNGRDGAGYCRRRDWLAGDEQAIEMVDVRCGLNEVSVAVCSGASLRVSVDDAYRSRRASSASAAIPSTS
jgi:hypothetical protein